MKKYIFLGLLVATNLMAHELTLYFIPSPKGLDWSGPSNLAYSVIKNKLTLEPRFLGHVFVELKCGDENILSSMKGTNFDYLNKIFVEETGLSVLYQSFDGKLEEKADIQQELLDYQNSGEMNFAHFKLSENQCKRVSQYYQEYLQKNVGRAYGLTNRPRFGEGAGSATYAVSFLDVLNLLDQDMKESWSETLNIPLEFSGPPLTDNKVSFLKLWGNGHSWAKENEKHQKLIFWNPDNMHKWVKNKIASKHGSYSIESIKNAKGIVFDKSHFPVPLEPIWLQQLDPDDGKKTLSTSSVIYPKR